MSGVSACGSQTIHFARDDEEDLRGEPMTTPYRGTTSATEDASEAREVEAFARAMHAERRVWGNEHFGKLVLCVFVVSSYTLLTALLFFKTDARSGALVCLLTVPVYVAVGVRSFRLWRLALSERRRVAAKTSPRA